MLLPLLLIIVAGLSSGVVAYGTYPGWMRYPHGLEIILWSRRLQWPLISLSLISCILLIVLAVSSRRCAWWLIGLAPVLALFVHRFALAPGMGRFNVVENPVFISADQTTLADDEWVVGLTYGDRAYAYPFSMLFDTPVVIQADHEKRMMLMWSAFANRALALPIERELKGRDLEVVSTPANALLLYDTRRGEFINGLTGQTVQHQTPAGIGPGMPIATAKMPWSNWRLLHPATQVLSREGSRDPRTPTQPIQPSWPIPPQKLDDAPDLRIALIGSKQPLAVTSDLLTAAPLNSRADSIPVAVFREQGDTPIRALDRRVYNSAGKLDLIVDLAPNLAPRRHPNALFIDLGSNSGWNASGVCVDAPTDARELKGKRLEKIAVEDGLEWGVIKYWYPELKLTIPPAAPISIDTASDIDPATKKPVHHRPRRQALSR